MAGHAQLKFVMTECSKTQIRLTGLIWCLCLQASASIMELSIQRGSSGRMPVTTYVNVLMIILDSISVLRGKVLFFFLFSVHLLCRSTVNVLKIRTENLNFKRKIPKIL